MAPKKFFKTPTNHTECIGQASKCFLSMPLVRSLLSVVQHLSTIQGHRIALLKIGAFQRLQLLSDLHWRARVGWFPDGLSAILIYVKDK